MNLDPKILPGKRPLTCFDTEQAKEFLGKECYFSNCKVHYKNLSAFEKFECLTDYCIGTLTAIMDLGDRVFDVDQQCNEFRYCLPCEWVKEEKKEPKYRPYKDVQEFFNDIGCSVGDVIHYRRKSDNTRYRSIIVGTSRKDGHELVFFCNEWYTMKELFDLCEVFTSGDWQPFGVEE